MANLMTAATEYARRPKDERFASLDAYMANANNQKAHSGEKTYNAKDLRVVEADASELAQGMRAHEHTVSEPDAPEKQTTLMLESPLARANFTHWSFGQLCRTVEAPASYLRTLPPAIAADALNHGLRATAHGTDLKLLVQAPNGQPHATVRACTSDTYARAWDADLMAQLRREMGHDARWTPPPTWDKNPDGSAKTGGLYRGDRDSFVMLINGGSIVNDPSAMTSSAGSQGGGNDGAMYRGVMVRNSEVGASSITIETVLYRYICGNHILWGAAMDTRFRRRHTGKNAGRDSIRELARIAYAYTNQSAERDQQIIRTLIDKQIATTKEGVIDELRKLGASKDLATRAYELTEQMENLSPRSYWGAVQGLTRASQEDGYQDLRLETDLLAAQLLKLGQRVAA